MAKKKLKDLTINKVALVPAGANPGAHILLYKSEEGVDPTEVVKATFNEIRSARVASQVAYRVCDMAYDFIEAAYSAPKDSNPKSSLEKSLAQFAEAVTTILAEAKDLEDTDLAMAAAKSATDQRAREHRSAEEENVKKTTTKKALKDMSIEELQARVEELEKALPPEPEDKPEVPAAVQKMLDDQAEEIRKANERIAAAEATAKAETEKRERAEAASIAKSIIPHLPGDEKVKGNVLFALQKGLSKEDYDATVALLKAGNEAMGKTLNASDGEDTGGNADRPAVEQLDALAKQMVKDGKADSYAKAFTLATEQNPDLYHQYQKERRRRVLNDE